MSYKDNYEFAQADVMFRGAIAGAIVKAALDINGEAQGTMSLALWKARSNLAVNVLRTPDSWITPFTQACKAYDITLTGAAGQDVYLFDTCAAVWADIAYAQAEG